MVSFRLERGVSRDGVLGMQGTWLKLKALLLLGHPGTDSLQCPAQVQKFTLQSLGPCIHSPAILQACANGPLVSDTELGSWVDSESKEMVSALSNCNVMQNRPQSCAVGIHAHLGFLASGPSAGTPAPSLPSGLCSHSSVPEVFPHYTPSLPVP